MSGSGLGATMADTTGSGMTGAGSGTTGASGRVETDETRDLMVSDKVEGTAVYNRSGERLGTVHDFMVGQAQRPGGLRRDELRRFPRHRRELPTPCPGGY